MNPDLARLAALGWHLYPASATSKAGCFKNATDAATCDPAILAGWARAYPGCNWRVVCGASRLFALDVDRPGTHSADGFASLATLVARHGPLPPRPMTRTGGSGGAVLFFAHADEPLRGASGTPAPGLDPHRGRQAVMLPPSRHPVTGGAYAWRTPPWEVPPPPIPAWLAKLLKPPPEPAACYPWRPNASRASQALMRAVHAVLDAPSGAANDTLNRKAFALGRWVGAGLLSDDAAGQELLAAARARGIPFREAQDTIRSGLVAGRKHPVEERHGRNTDAAA